MGIEPTRALLLELENKRFGVTPTLKCGGRVNFRGAWGRVRIGAKIPRLLMLLAALPASRGPLE
jgi:hypothetical protein